MNYYCVKHICVKPWQLNRIQNLNGFVTSSNVNKIKPGDHIFEIKCYNDVCIVKVIRKTFWFKMCMLKQRLI